MNYHTIIEQLLDKLPMVQKGHIYYETIYSGDENKNPENEFLFFIKPEITVESGIIEYRRIFDLIIKKIRDYNLVIHNVRLLSAKYLSDFNLIARHYGVINRLSVNAVDNLSEEAKRNFEKIFGKSTEEVNLFGSLEFLENYPEISPLALDWLCQNVESYKISGGTYVQKFSIDGLELFMVNGFHPRQLEHFIAGGRSIITFTLSGSLSWTVARNDFTGKTNPVDAKAGSLRNELLLNMDILGLETVSQSRNGVHLSAGPLEALVELVRYNSDFANDKELKYSDFSFGKKLAMHFPEEKIEKLLENVNVKLNNEIISAFDLTEELDSSEAIDKLKEAVF